MCLKLLPVSLEYIHVTWREEKMREVLVSRYVATDFTDQHSCGRSGRFPFTDLPITHSLSTCLFDFYGVLIDRYES